MKSEVLSETADLLLSNLDRDRSAPHYTESSFRRKLKLANQRESRQALLTALRPAAYLHSKEWIEISEIALLTPSQTEVMQMRLEGITFDAIGKARGHTKQGAQSIYYQAAKKLVEAWINYPYRGLPEVYEEETRRGISPRRYS